MNWNFSIGWFFLGVVIVIIGTLMVVFYRPISDNFVHGVSSYDKVKFWGIIAILLGLLIMANLHTAILDWLVRLAFKR